MPILSTISDKLCIKSDIDKKYISFFLSVPILVCPKPGNTGLLVPRPNAAVASPYYNSNCEAGLSKVTKQLIIEKQKSCGIKIPHLNPVLTLPPETGKKSLSPASKPSPASPSLVRTPSPKGSAFLVF